MEFKSIDQHARDVRRIKEDLLECRGSPVALAKNSTHHSNVTREKHYLGKGCLVDISRLSSILKIDPEKQVALVEPRVTIEALVQATLPRNLVPLIAPEFKGITVGGAILGASLESSSHLFGQFNDCCNHMEVLLGNGEITIASPYQNSDLFYGLSGSYGTLGIVLLAEIKLAKASEWVHIHYKRFIDHSKLFNYLKQKSSSDYLEAIIFSKNHSVVIEGTRKSREELPKNCKKVHLHPWKEWFYSHVQKAKESDAGEAIPLYDYLFRYDRGAFWMASYLSDPKWLLKYFFYKNQSWKIGESPKLCPSLNRWIPFLFGSVLGSKRLYKILHAIPEEWTKHTFIVQDFYIPMTELEKFISFIENKIEIYPLWLCPIKGTKSPQILAPHYNSDTSNLIDVGVYGIAKNQKEATKLTRDLEEFALTLGTKKMFYAHSFYSKEQFWKIYDQKQYDTLRTNYHASQTFMNIDEKVLL